jgi:hypothetical protein
MVDELHMLTQNKTMKPFTIALSGAGGSGREDMVGAT